MTDTTRVLVTGAAGQLGNYLCPKLEDAGMEVIRLDRPGVPGVDVHVDIADRDAVREALDETKPNVIMHGAAYTDVDGCERDPQIADGANHVGSRNLAELAAERGIWLIGISTDFVFPGDGGAPYGEDDEPRPISVYGESKLNGEKAILEADPSFAIGRTAWVYGGAGKHFPRTVLATLQKHGKMEVVDDEIGSPTFAGDLADALVTLIPQRPSGVLHLTNEGTTSRFGLAQKVAELAGQDASVITATSTEEFLKKFPLPAKRPANSTLKNVRAAELGVQLPSWDDALARYMPRLSEEFSADA